MSNHKRKKYNLDELLSQCKKSTFQTKDPIPSILESEWPSYEVKPFAYRVVDWRITHLAVVQTRERAHAFQKHPDADPRLNWIYAIYPDETEILIQGGTSIMDDFDADDFESSWKKSMQAMNIDAADIKATLAFYRKYKPSK